MNWLLILFFLVARGSAATWYIDNAASGANNGTSWANAWQTFAAAGAASASVSPGDTIYISGGTTSQTYTETLTISKDGTSGSRITIAAGQDAGHNGVVIFDGLNTLGTNRKAIAAYSYQTLSGNYGGARHFLFQNWVCSATDRDIAGGAAIWGYDGSTIEYCEIATAMNGIYLNNNPSVVIRHNYLHDIHGDVGIRDSGYTGTDFLNGQIYSNTILTNGDMAGLGGGPDGIQCGNGMTIHDNVLRCVQGTIIAGQHPDGIQAGSASSYLKVYNNYIANYINSGTKIGNAVSSATWQEVYVWNNVYCVDTNPNPNNNCKGVEAGPDAADLTGSISNLYIVNNTFVDMNGLGITLGVIAGGHTGPSTITNLVVENNILYNCGRGSSGTCFTFNKNSINSGWTVDYNLANAGVDGGAVMTVGDDPNTQPTYVQAHPRTTAPSFIAYALRVVGNNFRLASSDTGARGLGVDLSGLTTFTLDADGIARISPWDIGAYRFGMWVTQINATTLRFQ